MKKRIIITDSASDISELAEKELNIRFLNFQVAIDGTTYTSRIDFNNEEIIYKMPLLKKANITSKKAKTKTKTEPKKENIFGVKIGDVFYDSWGYEQTNIDFYQVVGLKGKTMVELKPVQKKRKNIGYCSDLVTPIKDKFINGNYKTRLVDGETKSITRRCNGSKYGLYVGSERLRPTSWNCEINETYYY